MSVKQIIEGTVNNVLSRKEEMSKIRMNICKDCPLFHTNIFGKVCNSEMFINPKTKETSIIKLDGYIRGCGCVLESKTRVKEAACPGGKW
jgi:hypothetical protein